QPEATGFPPRGFGRRRPPAARGTEKPSPCGRLRCFAGWRSSPLPSPAGRRLPLKKDQHGIGCALLVRNPPRAPKKSPTIQVACQRAEGRDIAWSRPLGEQEVKRGIGHPKRGTVDRDEQSGFERHLLFLSFPSRGVEFTERHPSRQRVGNVSFPF